MNTRGLAFFLVLVSIVGLIPLVAAASTARTVASQSNSGSEVDHLDSSLSSTRYVDGATGNDTTACTNPTAPCATISYALSQAGNGDEIHVAEGIYMETLDVGISVSLKGGYEASGWTRDIASHPTTVDANWAGRPAVSITPDTNVDLEGFAVQRANGSGIMVNRATVVISGTLVRCNSVGISNGAGTLTLYSSSVSDNHGTGISNGHVSNLTVNTSTVSSNKGTGIRNDHTGAVTVNNSTVSDNRGQGGIYNWGCAFDPAWYDARLTVNSSTISGNTSVDKFDRYGGGIQNMCGTVTLKNTIIAGNTAASAPDCYSVALPIYSSGHNLIGNTSGCTFSSTAGDLTNVDANIGQLIGSLGVPWYHPLLADSPAIDAGDPAGCTDHLSHPMLTDQRGAARVGRCDIGAYEYTPSGAAVSIVAVSGTPQTTSPSSPFDAPLQAAVLDDIGSPVNNATVGFSAPASGTSGTFADTGTFTTTAATGESGVATAATFTANGLTGSYIVTATASGTMAPADFLLGNFLQVYLPVITR